MAIPATQLRPGMIIKHNDQLHTVFKVEHRTPGNLRAFIQAKLRNLKSGAMFDRSGGSRSTRTGINYGRRGNRASRDGRDLKDCAGCARKRKQIAHDPARATGHDSGGVDAAGNNNRDCIALDADGAIGAVDARKSVVGNLKYELRLICHVVRASSALRCGDSASSAYGWICQKFVAFFGQIAIYLMGHTWRQTCLLMTQQP